ncbi:excisionase, partial [Klebsiella pneumoniae]|uniref:excisionase n=1 Tax=Klebsiella pneumoniae TaxID=573 RepID=UPI003F7F71B3
MANEKYRINTPIVSTLSNYAKQNRFSPPAKKDVRAWRVRVDAELVGTCTIPVLNKSDPVLL